MKPLKICEKCEHFDNDKKWFKNRIYCNFSCDEYFKEIGLAIHEELKENKGCSTCKNCVRVRQYPDYFTAEECECLAGLKCDTVLFKVSNCDKWEDKINEK